MVTVRNRRHDVAIIGGGIGGSALAAILARHGVRVVLIEGGGHPRFAIGESTVPETTMGLRALAERYDVPEIGDLAAHGRVRRRVTTASGIKRNFGFAFHREGEPFDITECTQHPTFPAPLGPDVHFFRQDVDAYLYQVALSYGATGLNHTFVEAVDFDAEGATVSTADRGEFRVGYVVDAGGMNSVLARQLDLRVTPPTYRTQSRSLFSHFVDVEPFDAVVPPSQHGMPGAFSQGTLHHIFEGGWAWVIPFDNHSYATNRSCSVGINLDVNRYPLDAAISPEDEFWSHVRRFPTFAHQMRDARAVRPITRSQRNQFQSDRLVGDRWCLLPHASDFIDPLFSSGLAVTVMALHALGHRLIDAVRHDDFSVEHFEYLEIWTKRVFAYYDAVVHNSYTSFERFDLWNAWFRVLNIGFIYGSNALMEAIFAFDRTKNPDVFMRLEEQPYRGLQAIDNPAYENLFTTADTIFQDYRTKEIDGDQAIERLLTALRVSGLVPGPWRKAMQDPAQRNPTPLSLQAMLRILVWGRFASPPAVRGKYLTSGLVALSKDALKLYGAEMGVSTSTVYQATRDLMAVHNRDWRRTGGARPEGQGR